MLELQLLTKQGSTITYPMTRAGVYKLARNLLQHDLMDERWWYSTRPFLKETTPLFTRLATILNWARSNFGSLEFDKIRKAIYEVANYKVNKLGAYCNWDKYCYLNLELKNFSRINLRNQGIQHLISNDKLMFFSGLILNREYKKALKYDKEYETLYLDVAMLPDNIAQNLDNEYVGFEDKCHDHIVDDGEMQRCYKCGFYHYANTMSYVENVDDVICEVCRHTNSIVCCNHCGGLIDTNFDYDGRFAENGDFFCCDSCAEAEGFYYTNDDDEYCDYDPDGCDEDDNEFSRFVNDYHSSKSDFSRSDYFIGELRKNQKSKLTTGIEFESEGDWSSELFECIDSNLKKLGYSCEHDGSLGLGGFEIVSQKMTRDGFKRQWLPHFRNVLEYMRNHGRRSHDGGCCGLHVHVSRNFFGDNSDEQYKNALKVMSFMQKYQNEFRTISRRKSFGYCEFYNTDIITKNSDIFNLCEDRYHVFNIRTNIPTFEFRLFRGTLDEKSFVASYDICCTLAQNAKRISWKDVWNPKRWFAGLSKVARDYLASRNVFEGMY